MFRIQIKKIKKKGITLDKTNLNSNRNVKRDSTIFVK